MGCDFVKKVLILFVCFFLFVGKVDAQNIEFNQEKFEDYFTSKNYNIQELEECLIEFDQEVGCHMIVASTSNQHREVGLLVFENDTIAYDYFQYVYQENIDSFENMETYNLDDNLDSNYSYLKAELSGLYSFYLVKVDNYIIRANIDKNEHSVMDRIFDDLGFIENTEQDSNVGIWLIGIAIVAVVGILLFVIIKKGNISKNKIVYIIIGGIILVILVIFVIIKLYYFLLPDGEKFEREYESLNGEKTSSGEEYLTVDITSDNKMKYSSVEDILEIIEKNEEAVVYFGTPSCLYCRSAVGVLIEAANESEIESVYYVDTSNVKKDEKYEELTSILGGSFTEGEDIYVPLVLFIKDGAIIFSNTDTIFSHIDPNIEMNESEKDGLKEIYRYGIAQLIE